MSFAKEKREKIDTVELIKQAFQFFYKKRKKEEAMRLSIHLEPSKLNDNDHTLEVRHGHEYLFELRTPPQSSLQTYDLD